MYLQGFVAACPFALPSSNACGCHQANSARWSTHDQCECFTVLHDSPVYTWVGAIGFRVASDGTLASDDDVSG